jgi:transglutaminase-like putative cysteine protease
MHWRIEHTLSYHYSKPIVLDVQTIRLQPRNDTRQQLIQFNLNIQPSPTYISKHSDIENNDITTAWFKGTHNELQITATSEVELKDYNPFDFIITEPSLTKIPISYPKYYIPLIEAYISTNNHSSSILDDFLKPVIVQSNNETIPFLTGLVTHIYKYFKHRERPDGAPWPPEKTIEQERGACRDLAWIFIVACRSLGLASRFVSGYHVPFNVRKKPELHAWAEIFLPGAGWIGFDPSLGLMVTERYIIISASYEPALTIPTSGTFWGKDTKAALKTSITISK